MKEGYICKSAAAEAGELEQINRFTRREFTAKELYTFTVVLCDNEVDRDYERFSPDALQKLGELFVGKPGLFDHEPKASLQTARIFSAAVERPEGEVNSLGEAYCRLTARAYLPRTEANEVLITEIESGIKKEVSVGCAVKKRVCSICGREDGRCSHVRGRTYDGKLCYYTLEDPADAYEWSFVAVPAQRAAGVTKRFAAEHGGAVDLETLKSMTPAAVVLSSAEVTSLQEELQKLYGLAATGRRRQEEQVRRILRAAAVFSQGIPAQTVRKSLAVLEPEELEAVAEACTKALGTPRPQLAPEHREKTATAENKEFYI